MIKTEVCIIGAGPGGCATALRLYKEGIPFIIIDKKQFPRDKPCGDALSGKVINVLKKISPEILERLASKCEPLSSKGTRFIVPGDYVFDVPFITKKQQDEDVAVGYTLKRESFDAFMANEVKMVAGDNMIVGDGVKSVKWRDDRFLVQTEEQEVEAKIIIVAAGTTAAFTTVYDKPKAPDNKAALAVRAYYEGVSGCHEDNYIELYFADSILPGYFWIFPLPNGVVNVGLGLRKDILLKNKSKLSKIMDEIITSNPLIAPRFKNAERVGKIAAYTLPLGNPDHRISGDSYMLVGDSAQLVDPLSGEGVGNAMYSGLIAAEQAIDCFTNNRFDADFNMAYDKRVMRVLGSEMKVSDRLQKMMKYPRMIKWIAKRASKNKHMPDILSAMFVDIEYRKKLMNPLFMLKILFNR